MKKAQINFGVFLPFYAFKTEVSPHQMFTRLKEVTLQCEQLGFHSVWLDDHLMHGKTPILECWSTLSALAAETSRIRISTMVTSNAFRNPAVLAKAASTVDAISNGRLEFGIGAGVQKEEHCAYGLPFPAPNERVGRLDEAIEIVKSLWTEEKTVFKGKHYHLDGAMCEPKPVQKPYPPITVGGSGEKLTLKVTAKHADRADFGYQPTISQYRRKLEALRKHCKEAGRPFEEVEKSCWPAGQIVLSEDPQELAEKVRFLKPSGMSHKDFESFTFAGSPAEFAEVLNPYKDLGVSQFMLFFADLPDFGSLRAFARSFAIGKS